MRLSHLARPKRRTVMRWLLPVGVLVAVAVFGAWFLQSTIPRRIVLATGPLDGLHHELAQRYTKILARDGVEIVERVSGGADENVKLLHDSGPRRC